MMTKMWSLRWRLTAWYISALLVILLIFGGLMSAMMSRQMHRRIDAELSEEAKELGEEIGRLSSIDAIRSRFNQHFAEHGGFSFQVSRVDGTVVCGSSWLRAHSLPRPKHADEAITNSLQDFSLPAFGLHRVILRKIQGPSEPLLIHVLVPYANSYREFNEFLNILVMAGLVALLTACAGGLMIARRALQPLERITQAAERISSSNLSTSIAIDNPRDELGRLTATLNRTFHRLNESMNKMQRFTADAAHELRTPLAVLRTRLEVALRGVPNLEQFQNSYEIALEQTNKLTALIDQLLMLSRQDAGVQSDLFEDVEMRPLLEDVAELLQIRASSKGVTLILDSIPDCAVLGDDIALSRLFFNLIENAIKYTPADGSVEVNVTCDQNTLCVTVADTGIGVAKEHLPKLFDRFYRVDASRNSQTGGAGLGLAICRSIVEAHQGQISVISEIGQGTTFSVVLPLVPGSPRKKSFAEVEYV